MHFHLPKPLHGWRVFAGEVGIIVIGVLIALSAEALVESLRDRELLHQTEQRMMVEIRDDDLPQAFARTAIGACNGKQLDAIETAVESRSRADVVRLPSTYDPPFRTWDDDAWKAALASQALKYGGGDRAVAWSAFYVGMPLMNEWTSNEQQMVRQLRARIGGSGPLSAVQQDRLFQLIADLRGTNQRMTGGGRASLRNAAALGIQVRPAERSAILVEARRHYGACIVDPAQSVPGPAPAGQYDAAAPASQDR